MKKWQLQEAKAKLSELLQKASYTPQQISIIGKIIAVVLSIEQYNLLISPKSFVVKFLQKSPLFGIDLEISRDQSSCREIEL